MDLPGDYRACRTLVRTEDRDRYLSVLFAPPEKRQHLFALYAFNIEIARIPELVREPMMGEMRLQWWRDALDGVAAGDVARNPVANALLDTMKCCDLSRALLSELIDARAFDLYGEPMESLARLESYLDSTSVSLMRLAAELLAGQETPEIVAAATRTGRAYAITGLLRSFAPHASRGRIFLPPLDVLARHGSSVEEAVSGAAKTSLHAALREMRDLARLHWMEGTKALSAIPKDARAAFLPAALVPAYLDQMEKRDYDPFRTRIEIPAWKRPWLLWRAARSFSSPLPGGERSRAKRAGEGGLLVLARPLLDIPKTRLIATLEKAGIDFADDVSNRDPRFTRVRWRGLMPSLSDEGLDSRALSRLARRAGRADEALDHVTLGIGRLLVRRASDGRERLECQRLAFVALPDEIRLRLLGGMIAAVGGEGPPELGKLETMLDMVNGILVSGDRLRRSLAGAIVAVEKSHIAVEKAPPRRPVTKRS
jgi:phytoene synthase